jgi:hypothetical protein
MSDMTLERACEILNRHKHRGYRWAPIRGNAYGDDDETSHIYPPFVAVAVAKELEREAARADAGPSREWLERAADAEDKVPGGPSVGGLAVDLGMHKADVQAVASKPILACPTLECADPREVEWDRGTDVCRVVCRGCGLAGPGVDIDFVYGCSAEEEEAAIKGAESEAVDRWNNIPRPNGSPDLRSEAAAVLEILEPMADGWVDREGAAECVRRLRAAMEGGGGG